MALSYVTAGILAGGYLRSDGRGIFLTHRVQLDDGRPVRALCGKVAPRNLNDDSTQHTQDMPTCPACARKKATLDRG